MTSIQPKYGALEVRHPFTPDPSSDDSNRVSAPANNALNFCAATSKQKCNYFKAMLLEGTINGLEMVNDKSRYLLSVLSAARLSGILSYSTQATTNFWMAMNGGQFEGRNIPPSFSSLDAQVVAPPVSLNDIFDKIFPMGIDAATKACAITWALSHTFAPRIQRFLLSKQESAINQIYNHSQEVAQPGHRGSIAEKISYMIEYVMPVLFDGMGLALVLRALARDGSSLEFNDNSGNFKQTLYFGPDDYINFIGGTYKSILDVIAGEETVSDPTLYLLFGVGIFLYAVRSLCNYHHKVAIREPEAADSAPKIEIDEENLNV